MRVFIDIGHPAHVHYFKNLIFKFQREEIPFLVTARNKEVAHKLLQAYGIPFASRGTGNDGLLKKLFYTVGADLQLLKLAREFKPDVFLSFASPYAAHVAKIMGKKHIAFDDTENATLAHRLYRPFTDVIYSPSSYSGKYHKRQVFFKGFMELCYLHPKVFTPDPSALKLLGLKKGAPFVILRFVSWNANHDIGHEGLSLQHKIKVVEELSHFARVFITSESTLPANLEPYRISIPPEKMHDILAFASLLYGESATMASECAMLGVPSIYHDNVGRGYTTQLENEYGLVFNFDESSTGEKKGLQKAIQLMKNYDRSLFLKNRNKILQNTINVNALMEASIVTPKNS
ncbi:hypothetical protein GCM10007103_28970 [Salinimicrobium marinum]|uniref:DUF354 domain-containing protein n=1 Tax=Salinimicrobium marinum TaxID=680283 RepID=A0A918SID6_9FLAO|nr:DUF354 domain-containing protein [Salinimicrobium marinum]GHA46099.1 hypothetical protein GCM10007103_28970 [Salinimicrobium marinum]